MFRHEDDILVRASATDRSHLTIASGKWRSMRWNKKPGHFKSAFYYYGPNRKGLAGWDLSPLK